MRCSCSQQDISLWDTGNQEAWSRRKKAGGGVKNKSLFLRKAVTQKVRIMAIQPPESWVKASQTIMREENNGVERKFREKEETPNIILVKCFLPKKLGRSTDIALVLGRNVLK